MIKKKICIYPFTKNEEYLIQYCSELEEFKIDCICTLPRMNKKINMKFFEQKNIKIYDDFDNIDLDNIDILFVPMIFLQVSNLNEIEYNIRKAKEHNIDIIREDTSLNNYSAISLKEIPIPVIGVVAENKFCEDTKFTIKLKKIFQQNGLKVAIISDKIIYTLFQNKELILNNEIDYSTDNIIKYNELIYDIYRLEQPDIIIVNLKESIYPLYNIQNDNIGKTYKTISSAIPFDYTFLCLNYRKYDDNIYESIINRCSKNVNGTINAIVLSNYFRDWISFYDNKNNRFLRIDNEEVLNEVKSSKYYVPIISINEDDDYIKSILEKELG